MWRVIVHVIHDQNEPGSDLEISANVAVWQLGRMLARALDLDNGADGQHYSYRLEAEVMDAPLEFRTRSISLRDDQTLAAAGIWSGATLFLKRAAVTYHPAHFISDSGRVYPLTAPEAPIGRTAAGQPHRPDIVDLKDEAQGRSVSRQHAFARFTDAGWVLIVSKESKLGSYLDDNPDRLQPERPYPLHDGSRLRLGNIKLEFHLSPTRDAPEANRATT